jgi:hypothetical protein
MSLAVQIRSTPFPISLWGLNTELGKNINCSRRQTNRGGLKVHDASDEEVPDRQSQHPGKESMPMPPWWSEATLRLDGDPLKEPRRIRELNPPLKLSTPRLKPTPIYLSTQQLLLHVSLCELLLSLKELLLRLTLLHSISTSIPLPARFTAANQAHWPIRKIAGN